MKKLIKITALIIILFVLAACNRKPYYKFNQDAKDFFIFKTGSWWLYENEQTLERDCMYIAKEGLEFKRISDQTNYYHDLGLPVFASKDSVFYGDATYFSSISGITHINENIIYKDVYYLSSNFEFPLTETDTLYESESDGIKYITEKKIYIVENKLYDKIKTLGYQNNLQVSIYQKEVIRERNHGMIKYYRKKDTDEVILNLIDFNINDL